MSDVSIPDLIPDEFGQTDVIPPIRFLRAQQNNLPKKTNGIVEAFVTTSAHGTDFVHNFVLNVPSLDNYTYHVFTVKHSLQFYPLTVVMASSGQTRQCPNEASFIEILKDETLIKGTKIKSGRGLKQNHL